MPLHGRRILVVEDDYYEAKELACLLARAGARPIGPVPCCEDALPLLALTPDMATIDATLRFNEPCAAIVDELDRRGVPFLFVTGWAEAIPARHRDRPVCHKPAGDRQIVAALRALVT